ncbi:MAG: pseudouridine synthase, partial [Anaerolineales bacterium]
MATILFYKPYGVLSHFTGGPLESTLKAYIEVPGVYAAGRLDKDSEGLLILSDDGRLIQLVSDPRFRHKKTYLAQVEGRVDDR